MIILIFVISNSLCLICFRIDYQLKWDLEKSAGNLIMQLESAGKPSPIKAANKSARNTALKADETQIKQSHYSSVVYSV